MAISGFEGPPLKSELNPLLRAQTRKIKGTSPKFFLVDPPKSGLEKRTHSLASKPGRLRGLHQNFFFRPKKKFQKSAFFEVKNEPGYRFAKSEHYPLLSVFFTAESKKVECTHFLECKPGRLSKATLQPLHFWPFFVHFGP